MKRFAILLGLLLSLLFGFAMAEYYPTNPHFYDAKKIPEAPELTVQARANDYISATMNCASSYNAGQNINWHIDITNGKAPYAITVMVYYRADRTTVYYQALDNYRSDTVDLNLRFYDPANMTVAVLINDADYEYAYLIHNFRVASTSSTVSVSQKIERIYNASIAAGCTSEYSKALYYYNWIIQNAHYDTTYSFYAPEGVLLRGTGVCDSYARAYMLLLERAGIECAYVSGGNHAWVNAKIDGHWCQIDPTWGDPLTGNPAIDGNAISTKENHYYFGLTDALMLVDHSYSPSSSRPCTTLANNYYIRTDTEMPKLWANEYKSRIQRALDNGQTEFTVQSDAYYPLGNGYKRSAANHVIYTIAALRLEEEVWSTSSGNVKLNVAYDVTAKEFKISVRNDSNSPVTAPAPACKMNLPAGTRQVDSSAFESCSFLSSVAVNDGAESIGSRAFANCSRMTVIVIPASVTTIASDAFAGCDQLAIYGIEGSYAQAYAAANSMTFYPVE